MPAIDLFQLRDHVLTRWPAIAIAIAASALGVAHFTEHVLGFAPCRLCYVQRWAYWGVITIAGAAWLGLWVASRIGVATLAPATKPYLNPTRILCTLLAAGFVISAIIAGYHTGVEWRIFPDPGCEGNGAQTMSFQDIQAAQTTPGRVQSCVDPPFVLPFPWFGLSMAGWNFVLSLGLVGISVWAAARRARPLP